ncbi:MAG: hypothetical protein AVO35_12510 [Candidatus Aegiribacteria sp. MLS_C]|nr:MAG: hypothetical protein AVO35_12510 [Candidatus Aegiribacteria sp. MLS_C]
METLTEILIKNGMAGRVVSTSAVSDLVAGSRQRRWGLVHRALESGELIKLKRGLYLLDPALTGQTVSVYSIANRLVPESYISMETALSYHGWLQEAPVAVQSCIPSGRSRSYGNPIGEFVYRTLPALGSDYYLGVNRNEISKNVYMIAGIERALGDTLYFRQSEWRGISGLCDELRIDMSVLEELDITLLGKLEEFYRSRSVRLLLRRLLSALGGEQ